MKNKYHVQLLFLGIFTILLNIVLLYFGSEFTHPLVYIILNILTCVLLLPNAIHSIKDEEAGSTDWKIFFGLIIWTIASVVGLIIYIIYTIKFAIRFPTD